MTESNWYEFPIELGLGLACFALALCFPYRRMAGRPEWGWDALNYVFVSTYVLLYGIWIDEPLTLWSDSLPSLGAWHETLLTALPTWLLLILYVILADFLVYWTHRWLHSRWLWPQHAWHHAPTYIYFASGLRGGPLHVVLTFLPYTVAALVVPVFYYEGTILILLVVNSLNQHYLHSNLRVPGARAFEKILVTPRMHLIHHHAQPRCTDSNYGFLFSVWDRWFGTFTDPDAVGRDEALGLNYPASRWKLLLGLPARESPQTGDGTLS